MIGTLAARRCAAGSPRAVRQRSAGRAASRMRSRSCSALLIVVGRRMSAKLRRHRHRRRPGGTVARRAARRRPACTVALVERKLLGGTCVNTGCMPTKTLVASAYAAHLARRAADYGVVARRRSRIDMQRGQGARDKVTLDARQGVAGLARRHAERCTLIEGHARFGSPHRDVEVDGEMLAAPRIFINVGGRAVVPDMPGVDEVAYPHQHDDAGARLRCRAISSSSAAATSGWSSRRCTAASAARSRSSRRARG